VFIETVPNRSSPPTMLLRESFRDDQGRAQKRTLASLSKLPGTVLEGLKALLKGGIVTGIDPASLRIERPLPHGHVVAALGTIRKVALDRLLSPVAKSFQSPQPDLSPGPAQGAMNKPVGYRRSDT
jgi:hypothetical protein